MKGKVLLYGSAGLSGSGKTYLQGVERELRHMVPG